MSCFDYHRRHTVAVNVGGVGIGGDNPVRLQSMTNTSTLDTPGSTAQSLRIARAGGELVRLTAQGVREAENIGVIRDELRRAGCGVPLVADIHFNPRAAFAAAKVTDKVRINPGNFIDPGRVFKKLEYTDEEYSAELQRIDDAFTPFLEVCREHGTAIRIGVNHGSLSDRIMSRYGDTPAGMVESAMEFLRVAVKRDFLNVVISIKASNVTVMVETVRRMVAAMDAEGMHFPLHLGVTEAGDGEDGRIKSAVGIGTLLGQGIGDTIRVSLSEDPELEIPVARALADYISSRAEAPHIEGSHAPGFNTIAPEKRASRIIGNTGGGNLPVVSGEFDPLECIGADATMHHGELVELVKENPREVVLMTTSHANRPASVSAAIHALTTAGLDNPVIATFAYPRLPLDEVALRASADFGPLLIDGLVDGISISAPEHPADDLRRIELGILQAARRRISRTEYIACPGCGRTLFDLQQTLKQVKDATAGLKGLKIGVMGCIVNGPGEMADADYGYVGAGSGRVSLYKGKECIEKNIPQSDAIPRLIALIKACGDWQD